VMFNGNLSNAALSTPSSVNLTLTGPTTAPNATVTLGAFSPASPVYGQTVTLSATVTSTMSPAPAGSVVFTVDSSTYPATLSSGTWTAQVTGLSAGTHAVSVAYTSSNGYAAANAGPTNLNVAQAPLTVTANNTSMPLGGPLPTFTASYSGFENGDTMSSLSGSPSFSTTATNSSPAGTYPITVTQGTLSDSNYALSFVSGTLSVVQAPSVTLTTTAAVSGSHSAGYTLTITIKNTGTAAAANVVLSAATLGTTSGTPLPQTWGTIAAGGTGTFTVAVPGSAGLDGAGVAERCSGTYTGGSFSASIRSMTLP
jgi:hypothetical protein